MDYRWLDLLCMVNRISVSGYPDCYGDGHPKWSLGIQILFS